MPRLVVHIGAAKTATTFIQHSLYQNRETLAERGVLLPEAGRYQFHAQTVAHHHLAWQFVDRQRFEVGRGWEALAKEVSEVDPDVVLITSEALERLVYSTERRRNLMAQLRQISNDITIVYVVREQLSHINSLYNQNVKSFRSLETFEEFVTRMMETTHFDLDRQFKPWYSTRSPQFVAIPFDSLVDGKVLVKFLDAAGVDIPADEFAPTREVSNESLGPVGVEAARLLGTHLRLIDPGFTYKSYAALKTYRVAAARARENGWCDDRFWGWTPELAAQFAAKVAESNARFAEAVWHGAHRLDLPVDRPQQVTALVDQSPETHLLLDRYLSSMRKRYLRLLQSGPRKRRSTAGEDEA